MNAHARPLGLRRRDWNLGNKHHETASSYKSVKMSETFGVRLTKISGKELFTFT